MLSVEMWGSKKTLSWVAGHPAGELRVIPTPMQEREENLTDSIVPTSLGLTALLTSQEP